MRLGKATAEKNRNPSLTLPVKTRDVMEAYQMLLQGQAIDVMAGYYDEQELLDKDFWMMDKVAKLHHLSDLRQLEKNLGIQQQELETVINQQTIIENELKQKQGKPEGEANNEASKQGTQQTTESANKEQKG